MTIDELETAAQFCRKKHFAWMQLVVVRKTKPKTNCVRIMPGLLGKVVGPLSENRYLVDVAMHAVENKLAKHRATQRQGPAQGGSDG